MAWQQKANALENSSVDVDKGADDNFDELKRMLC